MSESIPKTKQVLLNSREIEIPLDWDVVTIGDVSKKTKGKKPNSLYDEPDSGRLPYLTISASKGEVSQWADSDDGKQVTDSQILMVWDGASSGTVFKSSEGMIGSTLAAFKFEDSSFDNEFAYYFLSHFEDRISELAEGTGIPHVPRDFTQIFQVLRPPISEQRRIADILSTVDEQIQQTDKIVTEYKDLRRGIVQDLYDQNHGVTKSISSKRSIDPILEKRKDVWLEAEKEKKKRAGDESDVDQSKYDPPLDLLFSSRLPNLPEGWRWVSLDTIVAYDIDYRGKTPPYSDSGVPVISSGNIQEGEITFSEKRYVSPETYDEWLTRGVPREGDLIVTTEAPVGKTAIYPEGKYLPTRRVIVFRTVGVDNRYLQAALNHPKVQSYLLAQSGGSTVGRILKDNLLRTPIPLPPKEEEKRRASALNSIDQKIAYEQETKHWLQDIKRGLMQDLLTGKVRVDMD